MHSVDLPGARLTPSLAENRSAVMQAFADCSDLISRDLRPPSGPAALLLHLDGLVDRQMLAHDLLGQPNAGESTFLGGMRHLRTVGDVTGAILDGDAVLLTDGQDQAVAYRIRGGQVRAVSEPKTEPSIRGPKDAFVEPLRVNIGLLRRKIRNPRLKVRTLRLGQVTRTVVAVLYVEGLADPRVLEEVMHRLERVEVDSVLEGGYLEQFIEDHPFSPFPQVQNTERPDSVAGNLLEGRIAILVDGSPFALLVPVVFAQFLQVPEDYYSRPLVGSALRLLRTGLLFVALLLPSIYVSIITFHQEMLPSSLLYSIVSAREGVPFPALVEALLMEVSFEVLREAGIRLPRAVGQAVSIVGALVIGQAAVQAGIVSAPMVIVVAITGIASFAIPRFNMALALRLLRFPFILLAGSLGLFGIVAGLSAVMLHLCSLRSFGVPVLTPWAPLDWKGLKDTFVRMPLWSLNRRPVLVGRDDSVRIPTHQRPDGGE
ncbi:MAG TPA: spore germination protein [Symbiobacteriaceae bacterium]|nr:spore germination protein [Symbiobacteriaceae bacterium]